MVRLIGVPLKAISLVFWANISIGFRGPLGLSDLSHFFLVAHHQKQNGIRQLLKLIMQLLFWDNLTTHLIIIQFLSVCTKNKKIKLNVKKTKSMILKFSRKHQFINNLKADNDIVAVVSATKLQGIYITSDLKQDKNTSEFIKKTYKRMHLLDKAASFTSRKNYLKRTYKSFIRSILCNLALVWPLFLWPY